MSVYYSTFNSFWGVFWKLGLYTGRTIAVFFQFGGVNWKIYNSK